jgi:GT2 family glycosyltransferase
MTEQPVLTIIMPTMHREAIFAQAITSVVTAAEGLDIEVIVVNDAKDRDVVLPAIAQGKVTVVNNPRQGASAARNLGVSMAKAPLILFVDNDMIIEKAHLERTLAFHREHPRSCLNLNWRYPDALLEQMKQSPFGRFLLAEKLIDYKSWYPGNDFRFDAVFGADVLATFYLSVEKASLTEIGGFNEDIPYLTEDDDLTRRLKAAGNKLYIDPRYTVWHNESDRILLEGRLARTRLQGVARRRAVELGMKDYAIHYSPVKRIAYSVLLRLRPAIVGLTKSLPNSNAFDPIYQKNIHLLYAIDIYDGYTNFQSKS